MTTALDGHITVDEQGIARIAGTRMKVIHLVMDKMAYDASPEEMQREFPHLTLAQVYAALTYYHDHKAELDAQIARGGISGRETGSAGVVYAHQLGITIGQCIDDLEMIAGVYEPDEILNRLVYLPLRCHCDSHDSRVCPTYTAASTCFVSIPR